MERFDYTFFHVLNLNAKFIHNLSEGLNLSFIFFPFLEQKYILIVESTFSRAFTSYECIGPDRIV